MSERLRLALLGDPVAHSRSPAIHKAALAAAGIEGDYEAIKADEIALRTSIDDLRSGKLHGLNVTMPLKGAAAEMADDLTALARKADSVNTLRARAGRVEAHSTDAVAFGEIFTEFEPGLSVLVLGTGGSARALLSAVSDRRLYISGRTAARAESLAGRFGTPEAVSWGSAVGGAVVVNATPLGMQGEDLPEGLLRVAGGLVDLPYGSGATPAVEFARSEGIPYVDGLEFLARQAGASFEWWTGKTVDSDLLVGAARNV